MYRENISWTRTKNSYEIYTGCMDTMEIVINKFSKFRNMVWQLCIKTWIHYDKSSRHITICTDLLQENFDTRFGCTFLLTSNTFSLYYAQKLYRVSRYPLNHISSLTTSSFSSHYLKGRSSHKRGKMDCIEYAESKIVITVRCVIILALRDHRVKGIYAERLDPGIGRLTQQTLACKFVECETLVNNTNLHLQAPLLQPYYYGYIAVCIIHY